MNVPWMSRECSLNVLWMSPECNLNVTWMRMCPKLYSRFTFWEKIWINNPNSSKTRTITILLSYFTIFGAKSHDKRTILGADFFECQIWFIRGQNLSIFTIFGIDSLQKNDFRGRFFGSINSQKLKVFVFFGGVWVVYFTIWLGWVTGKVGAEGPLSKAVVGWCLEFIT